MAAAGAGSGDLFAARAAAARLARPCCAPGEWGYISANGLASLAPSGSGGGAASLGTLGGEKNSARTGSDSGWESAKTPLGVRRAS